MKSSLEATILQAIKQSDLSQLEALVVEYGAEVIRADTNPEELTALHWAAGTGDLKIVRYLMSDAIQADPRATRINNFTPLHAAAMQGRAEICRELIEAGADVNIQTVPQGYAPLHSAAYGGHLEAIEVLLAYGAKTDLQNYRSERPIDTAQRQNQVAVVNFLQKTMSRST